MRPTYYLFYYRDRDALGQYEPPSGRFALITCSIVLAGLVAVAFISGM